jgi:DNA replication and repair protein RecF
VTATLTVNRITLTGFRNYGHLRLDTGGACVVLTGPNGAGKTNLLEAVSLLAPGRGLRAAPFEELVTQGGTGWAVAAELEAGTGPIKLGTAFNLSDGTGDAAGRHVTVDGLAQKGSGTLGHHVRILWLTPAMDRLFAGPASDRRRFLDRLVLAFDPDHSARVLAFEKAMRERNRLLAEPKPDARWLSGLEVELAGRGVAVAAARLAAIDTLRGYAGKPAESGGKPSHFPWVMLTCAGEVESLILAMPAVQAEDQYRKMLHDSRRADAGAGRTLIGPHRSDLSVTHGPKDMPARLCSTGEQKALLIGIVLAHARAVKAGFGGLTPILLLDEVAAHLDEGRRHGLYGELQGLGGQVWMTGTDRSLFEGAGPGAKIYDVSHGAVAVHGS